MKNFVVSGIALVVASFFAMIQFGSPTAFARPMPAAQMGQSQQGQVQTKNQAKPAYRNAQIYLGTVTKQNGQYVLKAGTFTYKLSDQSQAKKYEGKEVQITGKLNPKTNKINVQKIKKAGGNGY